MIIHIQNLNKNSKNKKYLIDDIEKNEEKKKITNDVIEIDSKEEKIFLGTNDCHIYVEDLSTQKNILTIQNAHEYGIWSIYLLDENIIASGGEDAYIKLWDIRCKEGQIEYKSNYKNIFPESVKYGILSNIRDSTDERIDVVENIIGKINDSLENIKNRLKNKKLNDKIEFNNIN